MKNIIILLLFVYFVMTKQNFLENIIFSQQSLWRTCQLGLNVIKLFFIVTEAQGVTSMSSFKIVTQLERLLILQM